LLGQKAPEPPGGQAGNFTSERVSVRIADTIMKFSWILLSSLMLLATGCLKFGENIEASGAAFDQAKLDQLSSVSGIVFPSGTKRLHFFHFTDGMDPSIRVKVEIPASEEATFLENAVFAHENASETSFSDGGMAWWKPKTLTNPTSRRLTLGPGKFVSVVFGKEGGKLIAYVCWFTT
jgi:hypothetical protein